MKGKINLLFITGIFYPLMGGPTVALDAILPNLVQNKKIEKIIILTTYVPGEKIIASRTYKNSDIKVLRLLISRSSIFKGENLLLTTFRAFRIIYNGIVILFTCLRYSINIVHDTFRYDYLATRLLNISSIMDIRSFGREEPRFKPDLVLALSNRIKEMHRNWAGGKIEKVPMPLSKVDMGVKYNKKNILEKHGLKNKSYICFVGRMTKGKGVDLLIEGFKMLKGAMPDIHLVLIGGGEEIDLSEKVNCYDRNDIHCLGELGHSETLSIMDGSDLVALTSRREGMGRVILEALQLGKKVLAPSCVDEFRNEIPNFVLNDNDPKEIKTQLKKIITEDNKPDYDLKPHEPERVSNRLVQIYEGLLEGDEDT